MENGILGLFSPDLERLDPERRLALSYVPRENAGALWALWHLDAALGTVVAAGSEAMIRQLKIAWWRDALGALDGGAVPPEPVLQAVCAHILPRGISGSDLADMTVAWERLLDAGALGDDELRSYGAERGGLLFRFSSLLLGGSSSMEVERAGEVWALADLARRSSRPEDRQAALDAAAERLPTPFAWPRRLRPLGMLVMLARRDAKRGAEGLERQGSPARMLRMLAHRLMGR